MKNFKLTYSVTILWILAFHLVQGQAISIKKALKIQSQSMVKIVSVKQNRYVQMKKVKQFFERNHEKYLLVNVKKGAERERLYFGAMRDDYVSEIKFIDKSQLKGDASYYAEKAKVAHRAQDAENASNYFTAAIALGSTDPCVFIGKSIWDYKSESALCQEYLEQAESIGIENLTDFWKQEFYRISAFDYNWRQEYREAKRRSLKVLEYEGSHLVDYGNVVYHYMRLNSKNGYREAIPYLEKMLDFESVTSLKDYLLDIGYCHYRIDSFVNAIEYFEQIKFTHDTTTYSFPIDDISKYYLGVCKLHLGQFEESAINLKAFIASQPNHSLRGNAHWYLALGQGQLKNVKEMRRNIVAAAHLKHKDAIAFASEHLEGTQWYKAKKRQEAEEEMARIFFYLVVDYAEKSLRDQANREIYLNSPEAVQQRRAAAAEAMRMRQQRRNRP